MIGLLTSINFNSVLLALIASLIGGVFVALIKRQPALKRIAHEREANLLSERAKDMEKMSKRIDGLEAALADKDKVHAKEIEKLEEQERVKERLNEAKEAYSRHRFANLNMQMTSLLMLLKKGVPVEDAVREIEEMRAKHVAAEAAEAASIRAAAIAAGLSEPNL